MRHICIQIWFLWNSEFSLKSRGSPQNHWSLSLNLRFKVADLPHLSWNLLQVAWIPPVPKTPKSTSSIFPIRSRVHTHFFVLDEFPPPNPRRSFITTASVIREPRHIASVKKKNSNYGSTRESKFFFSHMPPLVW